MKKRLILFLFMLCLVGYVKVDAQVFRVTGTVTDASSGETLPGVSIILRGTTKGTITDAKGKYSIDVPEKNAVLIFSFLSYKSESVSVNGNNVVNVSLTPTAKSLDEVVVVAYGTAKRADLTTAQTSVSAKDLDKTVNTTIEQAIQGRSAGTYIIQNTGQPGGGISVTIRGINSINGTNEPLYVIDGVQIAGQSVNYGAQSSSNPLAGINPADIADIQVLQGPSATALYGSRATNGVLLITTKRGKAGQAKITYNFQGSMQMTPEHLHVMNLKEYAEMVKEFHSIAGGTTPAEFLDSSLLGDGTNWQKELFKKAYMYKHQISISGGTDKSIYYISGEYMNQDGVAAGSGFDRYSFRVNLDNKPLDWLKVSTNLSFNQTKETLTTSDNNLIYSALTLTPQIPVKNIDGTWGGGDLTNGANQFAPVNPVAIAALTTNNNTRRQFLGGVDLNLDILKGLTFKSSFNTNLNYANSNLFVPIYKIGWAINATATYTDGGSVNTYWNWNQLLNYTKQFGKHNFELMASHESQVSTWKNTSSGRKGYLTDNILDINAGDPTTAFNNGGEGEWAMESFLGRLNYNYAEKYIIEGSVRRDGSSNFGSNNRWGTFPAVSAAWRISKEPFFNIPFMNELKLRLETGTTGNQGSGGIYSPMAAGASGLGGTGFLPSQYSNPDLKWEETKTNNVGTNIGLFKNRIQLEFDYYKKKTDNLIMRNPLPYYMGTYGVGSSAAPVVNIGALENRGWAFTLISTNIDTKNFKWETNFNLSRFKTKITKFYSDAAIIDRSSWWMNSWTQRSAVGKAPWLFRGYIQDGIFQNIDEINNSAVPLNNSGNRLPTDPDNGVWVGDIKYKDVSGPDGVPDGKIDTYDQTYIGNPWPKFFGGFTNTFSYKGFELSVLFTFTYGNDVFNYQAWYNSNPNHIYLSQNLLNTARNFARLTSDENGNVIVANPGADLPRLKSGDVNGNWERFTDKWVEDGSFIKLKNISLAYNVPSTVFTFQKIIKDMRIMFSAQNVATFTKYKGYDPEVGAYVGANASSDNQAIGVDYGRYPLTPVYTLNLIVNF